jgi:hypothetical protein
MKTTDFLRLCAIVKRKLGGCLYPYFFKRNENPAKNEDVVDASAHIASMLSLAILPFCPCFVVKLCVEELLDELGNRKFSFF